jgi:hypothetical protein
VGVSTSVYLALMLGVIIVCCVFSVPALFLKKCPHCGVRNGLDAKACKACRTPFQEDVQP